MTRPRAAVGLSDNRAEVKPSADKPYAPLHEGTTALIRTPSLSGVASRYIALTPGPISAVPVGRVVGSKLGPDDTTRATIELPSRYAPLPRDARAVLRQKTLLGETYVEFSPGTRRPGNYVPDGGELSPARVSDTVQLDEVFRAFDPKTRAAFQTWMQAQAGAGAGRGADLNAALGNLPEFTDRTTRLLEDLDAQQGAQRVLRQQYVFRSTDRNIPTPPCVQAPPYPGFGTQFPQLRAFP